MHRQAPAASHQVRRVGQRTGQLNRTPLSYETAAGHVYVAKLLLASGVKAAVKDRIGSSPLNWAVQKGHAVITNLPAKAYGRRCSRHRYCRHRRHYRRRCRRRRRRHRLAVRWRIRRLNATRSHWRRRPCG